MNEYDSNKLSEMLRKKNEAYKAAVKAAEDAKRRAAEMKKASQEAHDRAVWEAKVAENELKADKSAVAQVSFLIYVFDTVMMIILIGIGGIITDIVSSAIPMLLGAMMGMVIIPIAHLALSCYIAERIYNKGKH